MSNHDLDTFDKNLVINKIITVIYAIATLTSMYAIIHAYNTAIGHSYFQFKGWGMVGFIIALVCVAALSIRQKNLYDPWLNKKRQARLKPDERQLAARRRNIERSYRIITYLIFITMIWLEPIVKWLSDKINDPFSGTLFFLAFNISLFVIALPALLAAWQQDS